MLRHACGYALAEQDASPDVGDREERKGRGWRRQADKDRIRNELDYQVNLKAELGVSTLLSKTDLVAETLGELEQRLTRLERRGTG